MKKILCLILSIACLLLMFTACNSKNNEENNNNESTTKNSYFNFVDGEKTTTAENADHKRVKFTMENGESFIIELYPEYAPETCKNFLKLVNDGFYDGLTFHRIYEGFMAQGGDPNGDGTGGTDPIKGEFAVNGYDANMLSHKRGVVSMARKGNDYNSGSCQFFICYTDQSYNLDGQYAAFGEVVEGMETVDNFLNVELAYNGESVPTKPVEPLVIKQAVVLETTVLDVTEVEQ